jgi:hypothetical protein
MPIFRCGTFFGANYAGVAQRTKETDDPFELLRITASISRVIFDTEKKEIGVTTRSVPQPAQSVWPHYGVI